MRLAYCADDFTGATDTLATVAQAGLRARLYLHPDGLANASDCDVAGIATAARSMPPQQMATVLAPIGRAFERLEVPVVHYKTCSTFDSAPHVGSIGAAVSALRPFVKNPFLPIVGGQPSLRRYCLFGNLFAAAGANGGVYRLDRHPTMSRHPVTPMHEADLRRHLASQGMTGVRSVDFMAYSEPVDASGEILFDVAAAEHLGFIGRLIWQRARESRLLAVGPSSVAQALIEAWRQEEGLQDCPSEIMPASARGPVFVLSGSQSPVTAEQICAASSYEKVEIELESSRSARRCVELLRSGRHVLAHTGRDDGDARKGAAIGAACAGLLSQVLQQVPLSRVGLSGGDTSSRSVQALGVESLEYAAQIGPGVALCRVRGARLEGLELMLKGGQMGAGDVFERLIST